MPREIGIHVSAFLLATWRHRLGEVALVETSLQSCLGLDFCGRKSADGDESARKTHSPGFGRADRRERGLTLQTLRKFGESSYSSDVSSDWN